MSKKEISLEELKKKKYDTGKLLKIEYSSSGGMTGGHSNKTVDLINKELIIENQEWHNTKPVTKIYTMTDENVDYIRKLLDEVNFPAWREIQEDKTIYALDAPNLYRFFQYEKDEFSLPEHMYLDNHESKILIELNKYINNLEKANNLKTKKNI